MKLFGDEQAHTTAAKRYGPIHDVILFYTKSR